MTKRAVGGTRPGGAYSPGIVAEGRFVYVAGQVPMRDGVLIGESTGEQTKAVIENLAAVLADAGASLADVVRCGVFLADMADFAEMNEVYAEMFPHPLPARTTVGVALHGFKVEIDCVAVLPESGQ
jgi:2-iminobutanoate/2-iminopropanoate deaminase